MRNRFRFPSLLLPGLASLALAAGAAAQSVEVDQGKIVFQSSAGLQLFVADAPADITELHVLELGDTVAVTWQSQGQPHYAFSLDGGLRFSRDRVTDYKIRLRYADFDPLVDGEPIVPGTLEARAGQGLYIVQYVIQGLEPWREQIRAMGAVDHRFLANHANIWRMDPQTADDVAELPFVRWVGEFHPAYKLENELLDAFLTESFEPERRYNIVVGEWGPAEKAIVSDVVTGLGGEVLQSIEQGWIVEASLTPQILLEVIHQGEVLGIDRKGDPETDMNNGRVVFGSEHVFNMAGYEGDGLHGEVMDGNLDTSHVDWAKAPLLSTSVSGDQSHGTCTFGINFALGLSGAGTKGTLPQAQGVFSDYGLYGNRYTHTAKIVDPGQPYTVVYQSNSWGDPRTTTYTSVSQEMDDIIFINDLTITQSQSNAGTQNSRPQAWAKNVVAAGGINHFNNQNDADDRWNFGASIGPAQDGRVKPDLSAWYDSVWTSDADPGGYVSGDDYQNMGGTSAASPIIAGHLGMIYYMWHNGDFGNPTPGATVFQNRPHNTLVKAMGVNSARQYPMSQTDITRFNQGWGKPDLTYLYDNRDDIFYVNETDILTNGQSISYTVDISPLAPEFRATLVYSDRAGTTSSSQHRINDLSLRVTDPGGTQYWGNNGLTTSNYSSSGGTSNTKDTVENVIVSSPLGGQWTIEVFADEVNQDTHVETGAIDADFALVVSPTSTGGSNTDLITLVGPTNVGVGWTVTWDFSGGPPNGSWWLLRSFNGNGTTIMGHPFDIGDPWAIVTSGVLDVAGAGSYTTQIPSAASGLTIYLEIGALDVSGTFGFDSNMLVMTVS